MSGPDMGERDERNESEPAESPPSLERTLTNDLESLVAATAALEDLLTRSAVVENTRFACRLALEEIVTNIVKYAFEDRGRHEILFSVRLTGAEVMLRFSDDGRAFDPLAAPVPDLEQLPDDRPIGGLGIHLVRQFAERMEYERAGGHNVLTAYFALRPKE
jgi:anti-sigma regulatory factor (Ser/Thr protein kinase)